MDDRALDRGVYVKLGLAYRLGVEYFHIKNNVRTLEYGADKFMIAETLKSRVSRDVIVCAR